MKKLKRIEAYNFFEKLLSGSITSALFQCILTILVFVVISRLIFHTNFELKECIEFNMVASLSVTLFIEEAIKLIKKKIDTKLEDSRKLNIDYDQLVKSKKEKRNSVNIDGNKLIFIPFSDIRNSILFPTKYNQNRTINEPGSVLLTPDILLYNKQSYNIVPSSSASILMLIQYLNNTCSNAIGTSNKKCITDITSKRTQ